MVFPLEEFHSAQTVLLPILVSSAGPKANKTVSKPSLSQLPSLEVFRAGKGKAGQAGFRQQSWISKGADKWAKGTGL